MAKKTTGTALVKWEEELKNYAKETKKGLKAAEGKFISFKSGKMTFAGSDIPDNEIRCVVVGWTHHNAYYEPGVRFDPKNPQTPICYSFGQDEGEMEPLDESPDKQCGACAECPLNQFGSAEQGQGKACKNTFRIALIAESDLEDIDNAEVVYASIPPKSLRNWSNYVSKDLDKLERPHWSVITTMSCVADKDSQFKVLFKHEENIEDTKLFEPLKALWQRAQEEINFPYAVREVAAKSSGKGGKGKTSKFAKR